MTRRGGLLFTVFNGFFFPLMRHGMDYLGLSMSARFASGADLVVLYISKEMMKYSPKHMVSL